MTSVDPHYSLASVHVKTTVLKHTFLKLSLAVSIKKQVII